MSARIISFDTETTGLDFATGDRVIELGAVEILDRNGDVFRLDRIVQTHDNSLHVLDYKTGEIDKKYNDQVKNYKKILSEIYRENIYGYIIYVDLNKIVSI